MQFDYIIKNGLVFNSRTGTAEQKDLYVLDGRIAACSDNNPESPEIIDAAGKYVVPGLIDAHAHLNYGGSNIGAHPDLLCIPSGVTAAMDGGTAGYANMPLFYESTMVRSVTDLYATVHCSTYGVKDWCVHPEELDPRDIDGKRIKEIFYRYPDKMRGLKIRLFDETMQYGLDPLRKVVDLADELNQEGYFCLVDMHYSGIPEPYQISQLIDILRKGDVFTHIYQTKGEQIFDESGRIKSCILEGREKGILYSTANGRPMWSFANLDKAFEQGFFPDLITSDVISISAYHRPAFTMNYAMSVMSASGMSTEDIFRTTTYLPAVAMGIQEKAGVIDIGRTADIAVFDVCESDMELFDRHGGTRKANRLFVPVLTMKSGRVVYRQLFF